MSATVKGLPTSDSICQSYARMKKGPFFGLTVYNVACVAPQAALCIRRTLYRHVTIGTPMIIFVVLTVF